MDKNTERIERYLKGVDVPECASDSHRQQLRRQVLGEIERRQTMWVRGKAWRIAAAIALIGTGVVAGAVGVTIQKYRFIERRPGRGYLVQSENGQSAMVISEGSAGNPEQAVKYAQELALLKQQGQRKLVGVVEAAMNGQHDVRMLTYEYRLPDGQTTFMGERDPNDTGPVTLTDERLERAFRELDERGVAAPSYERAVQVGSSPSRSGK